MIGFPYPAVDPMGFLVDEQIRAFEIDTRFDLLGTGREACPTKSTGLFIVHEHVVPEGTAEVIHNVFPHVWQRTNPGTPDESVTFIPPEDVAGFVLFDRTKSDNQPYIVEHDYNVPTVAASPNNTRRSKERGMSFLSSDYPLMMSVGMRNPLGTFYLPAKTVFQVLFKLAPLTASAAVPPGTGIPNFWTIGANAAVPAKRIDFAGACVSGVRMPQELYDKIKKARRLGQIGPEGSSAEDKLGFGNVLK